MGYAWGGVNFVWGRIEGHLMYIRCEEMKEKAKVTLCRETTEASWEWGVSPWKGREMNLPLTKKAQRKDTNVPFL